MGYSNDKFQKEPYQWIASIECSFWDDKCLQVSLALFAGSEMPTVRQLQILRELSEPHPSIFQQTLHALHNAIAPECAHLNSHVGQFAVADPMVFIPPAFATESPTGIVFTLEFGDIMQGRFVASALVNDWSLSRVIVQKVRPKSGCQPA